MRIVSGQYKGKPISAPEGRSTRPTSDRARESMFNILEHAPWAPEMAGARAEVGGVAPVDAGAAVQMQGLDVVADGAARRLVGLHEQAEGAAARQGLQP